MISELGQWMGDNLKNRLHGSVAKQQSIRSYAEFSGDGDFKDEAEICKEYDAPPRTARTD